MTATNMPRRVYIETYGCQMNEDDSDRILRLLGDLNYVETKEAEHADLVLINTCSVREKPEHKVYSALGRYKKLKEERGTIIGVAGCVAQQEGERLLNRVPYLDMVIGTQSLHLLPQMLDKIDKKERVCETGSDAEGKYLKAPPFKRPLARVKSYVTIMQGCDHFCSFCIVPYVRGREKTRPSGEVLEEVRHLADMGVKEVCLLGQNVNSYGKGVVGELDFSDLLSRINDVKGIQRIRFTTSHPQDLSERLIQTFSKLEKLCEHIHLPFQSGSDRVLKRMRRGYTKASYMEKIDRLKSVCPPIAITGDGIVGFPGEGEEDFEETLNLINTVRFDDLFSFKYSPRKGTRAAQFEDRVEEKVKQERLSILQDLQREITFQKNRALEGQVVDVLVEGRSKQSDREVTGRTRSNKPVNVEGDLSWVGTLIPVQIVTAYPHSLRGEKVR
ncbi:MAG: tRNA (N6-isopentenyl adenosine(37)-C2)-methylthiotransferase MiaB [Deltaproteobacteria bacterium]